MTELCSLKGVRHVAVSCLQTLRKIKTRALNSGQTGRLAPNHTTGRQITASREGHALRYHAQQKRSIELGMTSYQSRSKLCLPVPCLSLWCTEMISKIRICYVFKNKYNNFLLYPITTSRFTILHNINVDINEFYSTKPTGETYPKALTKKFAFTSPSLTTAHRPAGWPVETFLPNARRSERSLNSRQSINVFIEFKKVKSARKDLMRSDVRLLALERHNLWSCRLVHPGAPPAVRRFLENWVTRWNVLYRIKVRGGKKGHCQQAKHDNRNPGFDRVDQN
ncbi:hypothetical protein HNY73_001508 [Argiope bruennichi]|uniref:Uncharacterized protein n=1 Tax=Argiope bruennichi TaxID=94029 RepID=A0A8T0G551_ARGBR|nr:hypothetical protein HNY73_001508 [Argiope bruennichi]